MNAVRKREQVPRSKPKTGKNKTGKRPEKLNKTKKAKKPVDIEYVRFNTRQYRIPFHIIFTVFLIFAGGVGTAFSFAYLQDMRRQIESKRFAIQQQREDNITLRAEITRHLSIDEIARIAQERLNMGPADISQIVRINVPRQSYVVQSEALINPEPQGMWQSALWHIRNWLGI